MFGAGVAEILMLPRAESFNYIAFDVYIHGLYRWHSALDVLYIIQPQIWVVAVVSTFIKMRLCDVNAEAFPQGVELIPLEHRYNRYQRMVFSSGGSCGAIIMEIGHALRVVVWNLLIQPHKRIVGV